METDQKPKEINEEKMAEISCPQIRDPNDAVPHHHHRRRHHQRREETLTQILDSLPCWNHADDFDLDVSDTEFAPATSTAVSAGEVSGSDSVVPAAPGVDLLDRRSFVMDLFHQRVEQSQVTPHEDIDNNEDSALGAESVFGVIEGNGDVGTDSSESDIGLGLEFGGGFVVENIGDSDDDASVDVNPNDYDEHDGVDFFVERRFFGLESRDVSSTRDYIRVVRIASDSGEAEDVSENENQREIWGIDLNAEGVYVNNDCDDDHDDDASVTIPLCWDSLQLEDRRETNEDFEWEEVDGGVVDEREVLSVFAEADNDDENSVSISVSPIITQDDLASGERADGLGNLGWEVLLNSRNLETNIDLESNMDLYFGDHDDYIHTTEYEMLFEQFAEAEISVMGRPPASKAFVKNLPSVVLTEEDAENGNVLCAVCKDEMNVGSRAAQLPCTHRYHRECIVPWLGMRNTCPVCRHELPTDDIEYESRKSQRAGRGL